MKLTLDAKPDRLEFEIQSSALVVVDMQNAFAAKGGVFDIAGVDISPVPQLTLNIKSVVERARQSGMTIVYLQMGYKSDLSDSGGPDSPNRQKEFALVLVRERPELKDTLISEGTWNFAVVKELTPLPGDLIVRKSRYSGFASTELHALLRERNIRYLFFVGMATNVCVESTLRDAYFLEYWPILIPDCTMQAGPPVLQEATIMNVENHFGWTLSSRSFLEVLSMVD